MSGNAEILKQLRHIAELQAKERAIHDDRERRVEQYDAWNHVGDAVMEINMADVVAEIERLNRTIASMLKAVEEWRVGGPVPVFNGIMPTQNEVARLRILRAVHDAASGNAPRPFVEKP